MWRTARLTTNARIPIAAVVLATLPACWALGITPVDVSYQNGVDGYIGTVDQYLDERGGDTDGLDGSTIGAAFVDGFGTSGAGSPDRPALMRFDDILGDGPGQIPSGAFIIDAQLEITASFSGSAGTSGPWGVAGLLEPFDSNTVYANFPAFRGPWWQDATATRPVDNFDGSKYSAGTVNNANVRSLVQQWADGSLDNNGVVIQAGFDGSTDGWGIRPTGHGIDPDGNFDIPDFRPQLSVSYTTEPVEVNTFQRGLDGYESDTMARLAGGSDLLGPNAADDDETVDGLNLDQAFLDGLNDVGSSADQAALIKFDDVFGTGEGQAPEDMAVAKAWLVLTTGDTSGNARTQGPYSVHRMQSDWDTTTLHSDLDLGVFASDGPGTRSGADIASPALDSQNGMIVGSEAWFDVTDYLEDVRNGADDFGLAVLGDNSDGWQIHFNGSGEAEARPRLVVASAESGLSVGLPGDFNGDGSVDAADYTVWRDNLGGTFDLNGNGDETGASAGIVDDADYFQWVDHFGDTSGGGSSNPAAVPEPSTWALGLLLIGTIASYTARKK